MGYLGQKYDKGLVIQRSPEGSAFQENVDVTVDGDTEITPKVGGGIKKVNITSSGGGSAAKYVDLTDCFDDVEFDGQLVELDKEQLGIEDITVDDILNGKVIFTVAETYSFTLIEDVLNLSDLNYPWINMQLEDFEPLIAQVFAFENVSNIIEQEAASLVIAFAEDGKIYASGVQNVGSENQYYNFGSFKLGNAQKGYLEGTNNIREMSVFVTNTEGESEEGDSAEACIRCIARVNEQTEEPESAILLYGDQLLFNDQPIGGGSSGSTYTIPTSINMYTVYQDAGEEEDWPSKYLYRTASDLIYSSGDPINHNSGSTGIIYEALEDIFNAVVNNNAKYPDKIILGYTHKMRDDQGTLIGTTRGHFNFKLENVWNDETRKRFEANYSAVFQNIGTVYLQISYKELGDEEQTWKYYFILTTPVVTSYGAITLPTDVYQE